MIENNNFRGKTINLVISLSEAHMDKKEAELSEKTEKEDICRQSIRSVNN